MGKMSAVKLTFQSLFVFAFLGSFLFSGCSYFRGGDEYAIVKVSPESLHQIETLELEKAAEEEPARLEPEAPAPAELELSLAECRALVLENNLDLKVQLINPAIAAESVNQAEAAFESTFTGSVSYSKTKEPATSSIDIEGNQRDTLNTQLGVRIPLRTGGQINVGLTDISEDTNSEQALMNPYFTNSLSASISQPLLKGAGRRASEYGICLAELDRQSIDAETKLQVITAIASTDEAYWRLYYYRKVLEVRKQQYEYTNALYEQTEAYVNVGSKARIELIRARANVASDLKAIISAENDVRSQERELKRILNKPGLGIETETVLIPSTLPDPVRYEIQKDHMVTSALENRMELLKEELNLLKKAANIDNLKNQRLPQVDLGYTFGVRGIGASRGDAYNYIFDNFSSNNNHTVGLSVSIPLGNEDAESRLRQAIFERTQQLATREKRKQVITKEVLQQIDQLESDWQGILVSREATIRDDELYRAEKRQFELGMVTATNVLDAQKSLAGSQTDEISAIVNYQISLINLAKATGTLLGAAKVQWEPFVPGE